MMPAHDPPDHPATSPRRLWLRLFHGFRLEQFGSPILVLPGARRLVAYLGLHGRCPRGEVAAALWPDVAEHRARANLRTVLWRLRDVPTGGMIPSEEQLVLVPSVDVDVARFVAVAHDQITGRGPVDTLTTLADAGELLPDWYDDWVLLERERLHHLRLHSLEALARRLVTARRYAEAVETALIAVRLEPLRESATLILITAHLAEHNLAEAVRRYETFRADLRRELDVAPSAHLRSVLSDALADARRPPR